MFYMGATIVYIVGYMANNDQKDVTKTYAYITLVISKSYSVLFMKQISFSIHALPVFSECSFRYFEPNEKHINRICGHYVLIFILRNRLYFSEEGVRVTVEKNEWYLQERNLKQEGIRGCPSPEYFYIHFSVSDMEINPYAGSYQTFNIPLRGTFDKEYMLSRFVQLDELFRKFPWDVLGQQAVFMNILYHISDKKPGGLIKGNGFVYAILDYLHKEYDKPLSMAALSNKFNYSKDYIARKLKQETGHTPFSYVQTIRLQTAKDLLSNTDYSIDRISKQIGYCDVSLFYKAFKGNTGKTPGQWRENSR